ncbi:MAG TPA: flavin reductase family protein [Solirubrobacteraceae bacterium]|jgi:flavin reductase (DIM6/NTAB) family NADH-FMN oxidoreductase RutF|nr:flavin reductase family protein [Solirubrobacteraceae bacterium]
MSTETIDPNAFRTVLGHFPTGVVIVTAHGEGGPVGMACNSFASVSLDPPLVGIAAAKTSSTWPDIEVTGRFCINILASVHAHTSRHFSRKDVDRFEGSVHSPRPGGPGLDGALAWIDCEIFSVTEAGDHVIVLGRVLGFDAHTDDAEPLVFYKGRYGSFSEVQDT